MKTFKSCLVSVLMSVIATLASPVAFAQPSGSITNLITGSTNVLWDFSRLSSELQHIQMSIHQRSGDQTNSAEIDFADPFSQDGKGKLAGGPASTQVFVVPDETTPQETVSFTGTYTTKGSISSSKGVAKLTFSTKVTGTAVFPGESAEDSVSASANYTVTLDAPNNLISGTSRESGSRSGKNGGRISETRPITGNIVPDLADELGSGAWTLVLNFGTAIGNKLTGNATVTLNSGQVYPFDNFTGTFAAQKGSKLNLKGTGAGLGSILQVTLDADNNITRIVGRVSGQTVNLKQ